jgi:hypothetical protein
MEWVGVPCETRLPSRGSPQPWLAETCDDFEARSPLLSVDIDLSTQAVSPDQPKRSSDCVECADLKRELQAEHALHMGDHHILTIVTGINTAHMWRPSQARDWAETTGAARMDLKEKLDEALARISTLEAALRKVDEIRHAMKHTISSDPGEDRQPIYKLVASLKAPCMEVER